MEIRITILHCTLSYKIHNDGVNAGEYVSLDQEINVLSFDELPYGIEKEYMERIKPSGLVRIWVSVRSNSPRSDIIHDVSLKVITVN